MTSCRAPRHRIAILWTATFVAALVGCVLLAGLARVDGSASARSASEVTAWASKPHSIARHAAPVAPRPIAILAFVAGAGLVLAAWGLTSITHGRSGFRRGSQWFRRRGPPVPA